MWSLSVPFVRNPLLQNLQISLRIPRWSFLCLFKLPICTNFMPHSEQQNDGAKWVIMWRSSTCLVPYRAPQQSQVQPLFELCTSKLCLDNWTFVEKSKIEIELIKKILRKDKSWPTYLWHKLNTSKAWACDELHLCEFLKYSWSILS